MIEIKTHLFHELDCHTSINNCKHKSHVERWEILARFWNKEASIGCEQELECEQKERTEV